MSARIPDTHAEAWALLPWLANGRIAPEEREWVEAHVATCAECRAELATQRMVAGEMVRVGAAAPVSAESDEQKSFNKLWARIEVSESLSESAATTGAPQASNGGRSRTVRWLAAAVVVQAIGLGVLGVAALQNSDPRQRDTMTTVSHPLAPLAAPAVRLVFAPETSIETVNMMLTHQGLQLVEGPGAQGNFTAALTPNAVAAGASAETVAAVMKKDPNVSFAEPVAR
jgi:anti-sigma factor RsiW